MYVLDGQTILALMQHKFLAIIKWLTSFILSKICLAQGYENISTFKIYLIFRSVIHRKLSFMYNVKLPWFIICHLCIYFNIIC